MDLKNVPESKHFQDLTVLRNIMPAYPSGSSYPGQYGSMTSNSLTGNPPLNPHAEAYFKALDNIRQTLTPHEEQLMTEYGFGYPDIQLLRVFKTNPQSIIDSWMLRQGTDD